MHRAIALVCVAFVARLAVADIPGFENKEMLDKVVAGEFVAEDLIATKKEFQTVFRMYVPKRDADAYIAVSTDHAKYPEMIPAVKEGKTTNVNADRTVFDYTLDILVKVGPFSQHIFPEGQQVVKRGANATAESLIVNTIKNYTEMIAANSETTRIIPYDGGILIHDDVHFVLQKESAQSKLIQRELKKNAQQILEGFKGALTH